MPSREEIAALLNQVADEHEMRANLSGSAYAKVLVLNLGKKFRNAAAKVESMRCETCKRYDEYDQSCPLIGYCEAFIPSDFGCFHHEQNPPVKAGLSHSWMRRR